MAEENAPVKVSPFTLLFILARVAVILVIWLGVFLAMFLGYFTVPVLLFGGIAVLYALVDASIYLAMNRRARLLAEKRADSADTTPPDTEVPEQAETNADRTGSQ